MVTSPGLTAVASAPCSFAQAVCHSQEGPPSASPTAAVVDSLGSSSQRSSALIQLSPLSSPLHYRPPLSPSNSHQPRRNSPLSPGPRGWQKARAQTSPMEASACQQCVGIATAEDRGQPSGEARRRDGGKRVCIWAPATASVSLPPPVSDEHDCCSVDCSPGTHREELMATGVTDASAGTGQGGRPVKGHASAAATGGVLHLPLSPALRRPGSPAASPHPASPHPRPLLLWSYHPLKISSHPLPCLSPSLLLLRTTRTGFSHALFAQMLPAVHD